MKFLKQLFLYIYMVVLLVNVTSCREDELVIFGEYEISSDEEELADSHIRGFYLVNEGNMGSNKCTLDYYDYSTGIYARNIYSVKNPNVIKELGDVGNDIAIYGSKLYIVVNCSNKVEVLDAQTGIRIGQVNIPNCRNIRFHKGKAYVSSYVGPVQIDPNSPKGAVYRVDTLSLQVTGEVGVGYQPEEMEIIDNYLYVANSGGYRAPDYDNTVSVIDIEDFKPVRDIRVGINLHRIRKDKYNKLWVTSRGDYRSRPSRLYVLDKKNGRNQMEVSDTLPMACSNLAIRGDYLYYYATQWDAVSQSNAVTYGIINVKTKERVSDNFITDGTESLISVPYGIAINPENGDILVTDAKNYVSSGTLYCFSSEGKKKWSVRTGDIPAHIAFLKK